MSAVDLGQYITAGIVRQAIPVVVAARPGVLVAPQFAPYQF